MFRQYLHTIKQWASHRGKESEQKKHNFPPVTGSLRKLTMCAGSTLLDRFDHTMRKVGKSALVDDMSTLRTKCFNANHMVDMVLRKGDPLPSTGLEKLRFLTFGSPILRFLLHQIHIYVLPESCQSRPRKLLLTEDIPLSAQFWEVSLNLIYVESAVLHASLSDGDRIQLVNRFNDPEDSLTILIIMHAVSAQGVNLDRCCNRVVVVTNAANAPLEWQSWGRVIRVPALSV